MYVQVNIDIFVFSFELGVEALDYLDDILCLQSKIFIDIHTFRMSSMTPQGQCRLAPLIPLIQDSNQLYDLIVRLLFKLHINLPNDILQGHRERFRIIFCKLKEFYNTVKPLAYFTDLIQAPILPEVAPNFSSKVDFGSYIPPVVIVPEPIVDNLVDTKIPAIFDSQHKNFEVEEKPKVEYENELRKKDHQIQKIEADIRNMQSNHLTLLSSQKDEINDLKMQNAILSKQLYLMEINISDKENIESKLENNHVQTELEGMIDSKRNFILTNFFQKNYKLKKRNIKLVKRSF